MKSAAKPALEPALMSLDKALIKLETAIERRFKQEQKVREEPMLDLNVRNEREVNKKIAARLDQTIDRLEVLLTEE